MAKRIATQLADEIKNHVGATDENITSITISAGTLKRWLRWAKLIDARTRLDGSAKNKRKRAKK